VSFDALHWQHHCGAFLHQERAVIGGAGGEQCGEHPKARYSALLFAEGLLELLQTMNEDYRQAALRHWRDADALEKDGRVENADQLYGLAAECAVKSALMILPGFRSEDGELSSGYKEHINDLIGKVPLQNLQKRFPGLFALMKQPNPFADWHIRQRYCPDGAIAEATVANHRQAAQRLLGAAGLTGSRGS
jgi:hypothetical protein